MQIAISGTHFMGKSTLINDFIKKHPNYYYEIEPYHQLQDEHGFEFSEELTLDGILQQLDFSIERINYHANASDIIFDRCPVDFLAYAMHTAAKHHMDLNDTEISERFPQIKEALKKLNLIVFLPIIKEHTIKYHEEDAVYRKAIDRNFKKIYRDEIFDIFPGYNHPKIIEIWGDRLARIKKLESYL